MLFLPSRRSSLVSTLIAVLLIVFTLQCPPAFSQQDVGFISGSITDASGAVVAGAKVHIVSDVTGIAEDIVANESGYYRSHPLQPARYTVSVEAGGFATSTVNDLTVDAAAQVTANVQLKIGQASDKVEVDAQPPTLNTVDAQIGNTVNTRAVQDLPVNGRSVLALATLSPGVESAVGATSQGFTNRGTQPSAIRIAGGVPGVNNNLLDGANNLQNYHGEVGINVKADAIQEFRIMSGVIPAQFGYTSGGVVNVVTRSGDNQFHGTAYEFFRNDALDATLALPRPVFGKPELRFNNYGGTFGGPIKRDRAFFFGNYEEYRFVNAQPYYSSVPTLQERQGDFSDLGRLVTSGGTTNCSQYPTDKTLQLYNPFTATTTTARSPYAGNLLTGLDPVSLAAQTLLYPVPNNITGSYNACTHANNYVADPKLISNERTGLARVDTRLSDKDSIFGRLAYYENYQNNGSTGYSSLYYRNDTLTTWSTVLSETHVFSSALVNDGRIAILRSTLPFQPTTVNQDYATKLGIKNSRPDMVPVFADGLSIPNTANGFRASTTMEAVDDLTKTLGAHTLSAGFDIRFVQSYNIQSNSASGQFNFSANQTAAGTSTTIQSSVAPGQTYASFLVGAVGSASAQLAAGEEFRKMQYAGYIQDDWHASQRFTLNAGLRYDFQAQPWEKHNGFSNFNINVPNPVTGYPGAALYAGVGGNGSDFVKENWNDWGPRLGFAMVLTSDNKTVARGGYAIYYATTAQNEFIQGAGNSLGFGSLNTSWSSTTTNGPVFALRDSLPYPASTPAGAAGGPNAFLGQTGFYVAPTLQDPQSQQYTLTLSRELPSKTVLDVSYLGNNGRHFTTPNFNIDTLDPSYFGLGDAYLNASVPNPYAGIVPGSLGAATITRSNLLKPFPYMQQVNLSYPRASHFNGNYLYVTAQRRSEKGLQLLAAYTYGKLMSLPIYTDLATTSGIFTTSSTIQNWRDLNAEYSVDALDVTHRATIAGLYNLPFGHDQPFLNSNRVLDRFVGGFQLNGVMTAQSGWPLGFTGATNQGIATRPNLVPGVPVSVPHPTRNQWFNPAAFINPPDYTFGNAPRFYSKVRSPGTLNFDLSAFKTTAISERTSLELRIEAFNAFNKVNLGQPNVSFTAGAGGVNTNANFGTILSSSTARQVQLGAKLRF